MIAKRQDKKKEWARNIFLVILAVGVVVVFFNLDIMRKGESIFSRTADKKLKFTGDLVRKAYTSKEIDRLIRFIKRHNDLIETATIETSLQDTYKKVGPGSPLIFEVHMVMTDGVTISTPVRRTTRKELASDILMKLNKDIRAYKKLKKQGKKIKSLVNTM